MSVIVRSRIAPTPSGYLHIGNAFNFLLTEERTRHFGGSLRLRIDDLDSLRFRAEYLLDIFESLRWLGIATDEGPTDIADHETHFAQQKRLKDYELLLERLAVTGKAFACTCSRAELSAGSKDGQYTGACRDKAIPLDTPNAAWRLRTEGDDVSVWTDSICGVQTISLHKHVRDFIIRRRDGLPAYHIASLCD